MKNVFILFVFFLILTGVVLSGADSSKQRQSLHPYVGVVIDQRERAYYNLFPNVMNFRSAEILKSGSGYLAKIEYYKEKKKQKISMQLTAEDIFQMHKEIKRRGPVPITFMYDAKSTKFSLLTKFKRLTRHKKVHTNVLRVSFSTVPTVKDIYLSRLVREFNYFNFSSPTFSLAAYPWPSRMIRPYIRFDINPARWKEYHYIGDLKSRSRFNTSFGVQVQKIFDIKSISVVPYTGAGLHSTNVKQSVVLDIIEDENYTFSEESYKTGGYEVFAGSDIVFYDMISVSLIVLAQRGIPLESIFPAPEIGQWRFFSPCIGLSLWMDI